MKSLQDALYNWLTIQVVCEARPDDTAAAETETFFRELLEKDHQAKVDSVVRTEPFYFVNYSINGEQGNARFPIEIIDVMLEQIQLEPEKYKNIE